MASEQTALGLAARLWWTPARNHPAHGGAFADVTQLFKFTSELAAIAAAIGPPLEKVRQKWFDQPRDVAAADVFLARRRRTFQQPPHGLRR